MQTQSVAAVPVALNGYVEGGGVPQHGLNGHGNGYNSVGLPGVAKGAPSEERLVKAVTAEYETEVHFQKCYGVISEIFEAHHSLDQELPQEGFTFLDLGCAPGGFSSFLLNDARCKNGFGVTLPSKVGGFPVRLKSDRYLVQRADLFELGPDDLLASDVHICICDAQYLRNETAWDAQYRGVRCRGKQHGVWALLCKQFWLAMTKLNAGGVLIFRFGWRDDEDLATVWYKKCALRLFSLLHDLFDVVNDVKSDHYNALQSSFYVCCTGFNRQKFLARQVAKLLGKNFNYLITTPVWDANELEILAEVDKIRTEATDKKISDMLDRVEKLRRVHEDSRKRHEQRVAEYNDPWAVVFISPAPSTMSEQDLNKVFSVYGRVKRIVRDGEAEVAVQFESQYQAKAAASALRAICHFGSEVKVWTREDDAAAAADSGLQAWTSDWSVAMKPQSSESTPLASRNTMERNSF
mmetsp:Transcript_5382/g.13011  ORF Transcript_5382/g.13011 Transcript_5382/m.13011 type:complete len:465 (-) Transcript_5382:102-1496(-)